MGRGWKQIFDDPIILAMFVAGIVVIAIPWYVRSRGVVLRLSHALTAFVGSAVMFYSATQMAHGPPQLAMMIVSFIGALMSVGVGYIAIKYRDD